MYKRIAPIIGLAVIALVLVVSFISLAQAQPAAFNLTFPENNKNTNDNTPTFQWQGAVGADNYGIVIDDSPDFGSPWYDNDNLGNITSFTLPDENALPSPDGLWWWRVRAENAEGVTWSAENWCFRLDKTPPSAPWLNLPPDGENTGDNTPSLGWSCVNDMSTPVLYYAAVSDNSEFPYENRYSGWIENINWEVTPALPDGVWYWRVRARDNAGNVGDNSETRSFTIDNLVPSLLSPIWGSNTNDNTPTFTWENRVVADNWEIWVDNDMDFSSPVIKENTTDNFYTPASELVDNFYHWRVRGYQGAKIGAFSSEQGFRVDTLAPLAPSLVWPTDNVSINDNTPNLDWDSVSENSFPVLYRCHVSDDSQFSHDNVDSGWISSDNYQLITELAEGVWYWRVQARDNAGNEGDNSAARWFRVLLGPFNLLSPENNENLNDNTPTITWNAVTENSTPVLYQVIIDNNANFSSPEYDSGWIASTTCTPGALPDNFYYLRIRARDNAGNVGDNSQRTFRVDTLAPAAPVITNVTASGITTSSATITWTTNENATSVVEYGTTTGYGTTTSDSSLVTSHSASLSGLSAGTTYHYRVKSTDAAGNQAVSPDYTFTTSSPPPPPPPPGLPPAPSPEEIMNMTPEAGASSLAASDPESAANTLENIAPERAGMIIDAAVTAGLTDAFANILCEMSPSGAASAVLNAGSATAARVIESVGSNYPAAAARIVDAGAKTDLGKTASIFNEMQSGSAANVLIEVCGLDAGSATAAEVLGTINLEKSTAAVQNLIEGEKCEYINSMFEHLTDERLNEIWERLSQEQKEKLLLHLSPEVKNKIVALRAAEPFPWVLVAGIVVVLVILVLTIGFGAKIRLASPSRRTRRAKARRRT